MFDIIANGASIPALGFGTFRIPGADVLRIVPHALKAGFRHIDTAQIYGNEAEVGEAIAASGVARGDVFLTTKVWVENYRHDAFLASVDESLKKLKTDYVDLLLLHWPNEAVSLAEQIGALNAVKEAGKVRHIGVSNFSTALMAELKGSREALDGFLAPLGTVQSVSEIDGLRVTLSDGRVIHFRPSGNAPEMRCYVEAADKDKAESLLKQGLSLLRAWSA